MTPRPMIAINRVYTQICERVDRFAGRQMRLGIDVWCNAGSRGGFAVSGTGTAEGMISAASDLGYWLGYQWSAGSLYGPATLPSRRVSLPRVERPP